MRGVLYGLLFTFSLSLISSSAHAEIVRTKVPLPQGMAVLGDSLSEAMLADYDKENPPSKATLLHMLSIAIRYKKGQRIPAFRKSYARPQSSWSGGSDDQDVTRSHYERLKEHQPDLKLFRFARSGSHTKDLISQAAAVVTVQNEQNLNVDYVTILIGANDFAKDFIEQVIPVDEAIDNVRRSIKILLDYNANTKILLVGLPPIQDVFETTYHDIIFEMFNTEYSCSYMRSLIYNNNIIFRPEDPDYQNVFNRMTEYDDQLVTLVEELKADYPHVFLKSVHAYSPTQNLMKSLSIDCFHLSHFGHSEIAEITWLKGFWPELE